MFSVYIKNTKGHWIVLCVASWLKASLYEPRNSTYTQAQERIWAIIKLQGHEQLLVGCLYRSSSSLPSNNELKKQGYHQYNKLTRVFAYFDYRRFQLS